MAVDAGRWANRYVALGETAKALREIEWARELCLLALKFEQEQHSSAVSSRQTDSQAATSSPPSGTHRADGGTSITMTHQNIAGQGA